MQWIKLSYNRLLGFYSRQSLIILLLVLFIPNTGCQPQDKKRNPAPIRPSTVTIIAPEKLSAGTEDALILVSASDVPDNSPVTLVALNSYGPYRQRSLIRQGQALFRLPVAVTRSAGQLDLIATVGLGQAETQLQIAANEPVDPILVLVGPRSIIANGQDSTMVVAFPVDRWGNPIQDNTAVRIHARHPDQAISNKLGRQTTLTTYTQHLLAWTKLRSG
jgi:hypothetical protein